MRKLIKGTMLALCGFFANAAPLITLGVDQATLPFVDAKRQSGIEVEIIRAAFASQGLATSFAFLPNARVAVEFNNGHTDVNTSASPDDKPAVVLTHWPITHYNNQAIFLKSRELRIKTVADLTRYRVIAWQEARKYLGPDFAKMAAANSDYRELANMPSRMLLLDRADVFVSQPDIFRANLLEAEPPARRPGLLAQIAMPICSPRARVIGTRFVAPACAISLRLGWRRFIRPGRSTSYLPNMLNATARAASFLRN